ncbi:MAG: elongation factor P [Candidatus Absconditabacteria bacterium]
MKIDTSDVKKGTILNLDGNFCRVVDTSHTHTGRGGATYAFKIKNIVTGATNSITYKSGTTLEQADISTQSAVYLYNSGDAYSFMENDTSEIHEIYADDIEDIVPYLKENLDVYLTMYEGRILGVVLPTTISYKVTQTVPGIKGDRSSAGRKPATLETGLEVQIPLHVEEGATVVVNTLTGEVS